jgi:hypothetical protein
MLLCRCKHMRRLCTLHSLQCSNSISVYQMSIAILLTCSFARVLDSNTALRLNASCNSHITVLSAAWYSFNADCNSCAAHCTYIYIRVYIRIQKYRTSSAAAATFAAACVYECEYDMNTHLEHMHASIT